MEYDVLGKEFFSDDERYADLINGLACGGKQIVKKEDLQEQDTQVHGRKKQFKSKNRDLIRKTAFGMNFAVIGIENQEMIDYSMPLRGIVYDVGEYEKQAVKIRRKTRKKKGLKSGEYLYGFEKCSKLHPVITFILYYGEETWDGAYDLHGLIDFTDIPEEIKILVKNYSVNIISIRELKDTSVFHTDIKQVFDFIRYADNPEKLEKLIRNNPEYSRMEEDAYDMAVYHTNAKQLIEKKQYCRKDGKVNMCKALDILCERERENGISQGISQGIGQGRKMGIDEKTESIVKNMLNRGMSDEDICTLAECSQDFVKQVKRKML